MALAAFPRGSQRRPVLVCQAQHGGQPIGGGSRQLPLILLQLADVVAAVPGPPGQLFLRQARQHSVALQQLPAGRRRVLGLPPAPGPACTHRPARPFTGKRPGPDHTNAAQSGAAIRAGPSGPGRHVVRVRCPGFVRGPPPGGEQAGTPGPRTPPGQHTVSEIAAQAGMSRRPSTTTGRPMTGSVPPLSESFSAWAGSGGVGDRFQYCAHCLSSVTPRGRCPACQFGTAQAVTSARSPETVRRRNGSTSRPTASGLSAKGQWPLSWRTASSAT